MSARPDWDVIVDLIPAGMRVLDLGCGDGSLLARLRERKAVIGRGVEKEEANVQACVAKGLSVRQGDIEEGLADFADGSWDFVILSQTLGCLQRPLPVLAEMLRVARFGIVSFSNAAHWRKRWLALAGRGCGSELNSGLPLSRSITLAQYRTALNQQRVEEKTAIFLAGEARIRICPAWRCETVIGLLGRETSDGPRLSVSGRAMNGTREAWKTFQYR